ncbi:hypothetical protein AADZ90_013340 [Aestuariibius sp. 2305UL40-4]|uniref:hypothetical protein n=1 Tax=Aestuariibius violaceus TaxID=3234132 RepID=UPI00345E0C32
MAAIMRVHGVCQVTRGWVETMVRTDGEGIVGLLRRAARVVRRRRIRRTISLVFLLAMALPVAARSSFDEAVALWLEGNDADSLPQLAEFAQDGHPMARILLARIETTDRGPSPYRLGLSREESRALFRDTSNGHRFGQSWLVPLADDGDPLARALMRAGRPEPQPEVIERLVSLGEPEAAAHATRMVAIYGSPEMKARLKSSKVVQDELAPYFDYLDARPEPQGAGLAALRKIAGERLDSRDPDVRAFSGIVALGYGFGDPTADGALRETIEDWVLTDQAAQPIADLCREACPGEAAACGFTMFALTGGYYEVIRLDSPLETVIPQERFLDSPRARLMALRRAAMAKDETNAFRASREEIAEISACAADLIMETRAEY